jgi:hypothetical protein
MKLRSLVISIALSVGAALSCFGQGNAPTTSSGSAVVIPDGTVIQAKLKMDLEPSKLQMGDPVKLEVMLDVRDRLTGALLIPKKARLLARVSYVDVSKEKTKGAVLSIEIARAEWEGGFAELHGRITGVHFQTADRVRAPQRAYDPMWVPLLSSHQVLPSVSDGKLMFYPSNYSSSNHSLPAGIILGLEHRVPSEATKAFESSRDAALKGEAEAQFRVGLLYYGGKGVAQDYRQAALWYGKAAEQGHSKAQNNLAVLYAQGQGVPQDVVTAYMWFNVAAASRPDKNQANLQLLESHMAAEQIAEGKRLAEEWLKQHPASH